MIENIKMLVMDVDGTLTDGKIYYGNDGELFKAFDVRDGYRLVKCEEYGIITAIITGKTSKIVECRARDLKIKEVHQGVSNKIEVLKTLIEKYNLETNRKEVYFKLTDEGKALFDEHAKRHSLWEKRD